MLGSYKVTNARKNIFTTKLNIGEAKGQTCPVNRPCESRQRLFFRKKTSSTFFLFYCLVCLLIMSCNLGGIITNVASLSIIVVKLNTRVLRDFSKGWKLTKPKF